MRGSMNFKLKTAAAAILAVSLVAIQANASDPAPQAKKHHVTKKAKMPPPPTVEEQIQGLRQEMQGQIDGLKNDLAEKDAATEEGAAGSGRCASLRGQSGSSCIRRESGSG